LTKFINNFKIILKQFYHIILFLTLSLFFSCSDSITNSGTGSVSSYKKVLTVDSAGYKFELYKLDDSILYSSYNDIGFKVFVNGTEKKTGFVKFRPVMFHSGGSSHVTPVSDYFYYDEQKALFTGYSCFLMASDSSSSFWFADYTYNDEMTIKMNQFQVSAANRFEMKFFVDYTTSETYCVTAAYPQKPVTGSNELMCILHRRENDLYREVDSAEMFTRTWKVSMEKSLLETQSLVGIGGGKYKGNVNFTSRGEWTVNDSIKYHGHIITGNPPPQFFFDVK
jgi:hypothetical protein